MRVEQVERSRPKSHFSWDFLTKAKYEIQIVIPFQVKYLTASGILSGSFQNDQDLHTDTLLYIVAVLMGFPKTQIFALYPGFLLGIICSRLPRGGDKETRWECGKKLKRPRKQQ